MPHVELNPIIRHLDVLSQAMARLTAFKRYVRPCLLNDEGSEHLFVNNRGKEVESSRVHKMTQRFHKKTEIQLKPGKSFKSTTVRKVLLILKLCPLGNNS